MSRQPSFGSNQSDGNPHNFSTVKPGKRNKTRGLIYVGVSPEPPSDKEESIESVQGSMEDSPIRQHQKINGINDSMFKSKMRPNHSKIKHHNYFVDVGYEVNPHCQFSITPQGFPKRTPINYLSYNKQPSQIDKFKMAIETELLQEEPVSRQREVSQLENYRNLNRAYATSMGTYRNSVVHSKIMEPNAIMQFELSPTHFKFTNTQKNSVISTSIGTP